MAPVGLRDGAKAALGVTTPERRDTKRRGAGGRELAATALCVGVEVAIVLVAGMWAGRSGTMQEGVKAEAWIMTYGRRGA